MQHLPRGRQTNRLSRVRTHHFEASNGTGGRTIVKIYEWECQTSAEVNEGVRSTSVSSVRVIYLCGVAWYILAHCSRTQHRVCTKNIERRRWGSVSPPSWTRETPRKAEILALGLGAHLGVAPWRCHDPQLELEGKLVQYGLHRCAASLEAEEAVAAVMSNPDRQFDQSTPRPYRPTRP